MCSSDLPKTPKPQNPKTPRFELTLINIYRNNLKNINFSNSRVLVEVGQVAGISRVSAFLLLNHTDNGTLVALVHEQLLLGFTLEQLLQRVLRMDSSEFEVILENF